MADAVTAPVVTTGTGSAGGAAGAGGIVSAPPPAAPAASPPAATPEQSPWSKTGTEEKKDDKPKAEVKYDLKLPKDSHMDPAAVDKFASFAKERGLTNEQAQAVLEANHEERKALIESGMSQLKSQNAEWLKALKDDKEFGGDKFSENADYAKKAFDRFDKDGQLRKALIEGHLDNHPGLVKFVTAIGKAFREDKVTAPTLNAPAKDTRDPREKLKEVYARQREGQK